MMGTSLKIAVAFLVCVALVPAILFNANGGYGSPLQGNRNIDGYLKLTILSLHGVLVAMWLYSKFFDTAKPKPAEPLLIPLTVAVPSINSDPEVAPPVAPTPRPAGGGARDAYLDNIKSVLTALVVMHHIACTMQPTPIFFTTHTVLCTRNATAPLGPGLCIPTSFADNVFNKVFATWFLGINQDWFMTAFFFISAYFTPGSVDRKGARTFLIERAKRLSLPFLVFYFGINAAVNAMNSQLDGIPPSSLWKSTGPTLFFNEGPPWFISWLVLFGLLYVGVHSKKSALKMPPPTLAPLLLFGGLVGLLCTIIAPAGQDSLNNWWSMPGASMPGGCYMFIWYVIAWGGGVVARRSAWLEAWVGKGETPPAIEPNQERFLVTSLMLILVVKFAYVYNCMFFPEFEFANPPGQPMPYAGAISIMEHGFLPIIMFLVVLIFFKRQANGGGGLWKFLSQAAYTVYLIHPFVVLLVHRFYMYIVSEAVRSSGGFVQYSGNTYIPGYGPLLPYGQFLVVVASRSQQELVTWFGFVFICVVANLIVWPLAWIIKWLPGCRDVL